MPSGINTIEDIKNYPLTNTNDLSTPNHFSDTNRIIPYAPRSLFRNHIRDIYNHHKELADVYQPIVEQRNSSGGCLSCPICKTNIHVINRGSQNDGTRKFQCLNPNEHSECNFDEETYVFVNKDGWKGNFSTYTSYEAYQLYLRMIVEAIILFIKTNSTIAGLSSYLGVSRSFIEMAFAIALKVLQDESIDLDLNEIKDFVIVFFDYSGSLLSRRFSLILAKVGGKLIWKIVSGSNRVTIWEFIKKIGDSINGHGKETNCGDLTWIFITDGEMGFVDSIGGLYPYSIHIRQFHKKELRGLVYIHFPGKVNIVEEGDVLRDKVDRYTIGCHWNIVLNEGEPNQRTLSQRQRRRKERKRRDDSQNEYPWKKKQLENKLGESRLDDKIRLWTYVKYTQRVKSPKNNDFSSSKGTNMKPKQKVEETKDSEKVTITQELSPLKEERNKNSAQLKVLSNEALPHIPREGPEMNRDDEKQQTQTTYGRAHQSSQHFIKRRRELKPKPIVFDSVSEAKKNPLFLQIFEILVTVFGGLYIQSNEAENAFNVKTAIKSHRVMKAGMRILTLILHAQLRLKSMSIGELRKYFIDRIQPEMIMSWITPHDSSVSVEKKERDEIIKLVKRALETKAILAITYQNRHKRITRRGIRIDKFDGEYIDAYCYFRNENLTFRADRINTAYLNEDDPLVFLST